MIYKINNIKVDTDKFQILEGENVLGVEPKVFDLIVYLIENRQKVVSRDELFDQVWNGVIVSDTSLSQRIKSARKVLGDDGQAQCMIKTIHGRGYQFVAATHEVDSETTIVDSDCSKQQSDGPTIAILPMQNLSSDPEQDYLAEGISEDITTELSRFKNIQVISRHTAFQFDSRSADIRVLRDDFNIDYIIEGSIRRIGDKVRINIQLIDTYNTNHVWAERFDDVFENIYEIQDQIIEQVVAIIASEIVRVETGRSLSRSSKNLRAYDYFLRGMYYHKTANLDCLNHSKSMDEFQKAIDLDPSFVRARVWYCCAQFSNWNKVTQERIESQITSVKKALQLNPNESECHRLLGMLYHYDSNYGLAENHHKQALRLSPNDAFINIKSGKFFALTGDWQRGLELCKRAIYLNPLHPPWYWQDLGIIYYCANQFQQAIEAFTKNIYCDDYDFALIAASYMALKQPQKAAENMAKGKELNPQSSAIKYVSRIAFKDQKTADLLKQRIIKAELNI